MLDLKFIRDNVEIVKEAIESKKEALDLDELLKVDQQYQQLKKQQQGLQTRRNQLAQQVPQATGPQRQGLIEQGREMSALLGKLSQQIKEVDSRRQALLLQVPNIPSPQAPVGAGEQDNQEVRRWGEAPPQKERPLGHVEILLKGGWADFESLAKVSGPRNYGLKNDLLLLELALHQWGLHQLRRRGFELVGVPSLVREAPLVGTGHFPGGRDQVYALAGDDLYLSGTSEVQLNSLLAGKILPHSQLPILMAGHSVCFRREAGSYGRDVRGLMRVHQFTKIEQYVICEGDFEKSNRWHQELLKTSEEMMQQLELPYRVVECCTADMGTGKYRMFDLEAWAPSEGRYRETHSCSHLGPWQARRTNTRYRKKDGTVAFVHTLNNTALATPRILVPLLEIHQTPSGGFRPPKALAPYLEGLEFSPKGPTHQ